MTAEDERLQERINTAEEMLIRAIQQRKQSLARMTLDALREIAPRHPRLAEYKIWVDDLGEEMALQSRIDIVLNEGRTALREGNLVEARRKVEALQKLAPYSSSTDDFAAEVERAAQGRETSAGIDRLKQRIEEGLASEKVDDAQQALEELQSMGLPRITIQTYARRIEEARTVIRDAAEADAMTIGFERFLQQRDWQNAREVAQRFGNRFPGDPRSAAMFNRVTEMEAGDRRQQSIVQGLASLESFIATGKKVEAQLALKLLRSMNADESRLAAYEARISTL